MGLHDLSYFHFQIVSTRRSRLPSWSSLKLRQPSKDSKGKRTKFLADCSTRLFKAVVSNQSFGLEKMPAGVGTGEYVRFVAAAMFSMFLGSQAVHHLYRPLEDFGDYVAKARQAVTKTPASVESSKDKKAD